MHEGSPILRSGLAALTALLLSGCAPNVPPVSFERSDATGLRAYRIAEVDRAPRLIKCAQLTSTPPNTLSGGRWEYVTVGFVVTETGAVDNNSILIKRTARTSRDPDASEQSISDAKVIALSCEYEPAMLAGQPVRVSTERTFRILAAI